MTVAVWDRKRLIVGTNTVELLRDREEKPIWTASIEEGRELLFRARLGSTAYFSSIKRNELGSLGRGTSCWSVLRLDLESGKWSDPIKLPRRFAWDLPSVETGSGVVVVSWTDGRSANVDDGILCYHIAAFGERDAAPIWKRDFEAFGSFRYDGVQVMGIPTPDYADSGIRRLTFVGDRLLVVGEAVQPLMCLNVHTGTTLWEIDRLWEFERGFIGPSVYEFFIARFGIQEDLYAANGLDEVEVDVGDVHDRMVVTNGADELKKRRSQFERQWHGWFLGGPAAVNVAGGGTRIFVAVAIASNEEYGGHLAKSRIYEVADDGSVLSLLDLPRVVEGESLRTAGDSVVWAGQGSSLMRFSATKLDRYGRTEETRSDKLTALDWMRRLRSEPLDGWLSSGPTGLHTAFSSRMAVSQVAGTTVVAIRDSTLRIPLVVSDLSTGASVQIVIDVPFEGEFPTPQSNYSSGPRGITTLSPFGVRLSMITVDDSTLHLILSTDLGEEMALEFSIDGDRFFRFASESIDRSAEYAARIAKLGDVNREDEYGSLPLHQAADGDEPDWVRALLAAGAQIDTQSATGWTALMSACAYGSAEAVEILLAAGADVKPREFRWGGQTALIWAARAQKDSKRKTRLLLAAGARIDDATSRGWTPLMAAVGAGHLDTVEWLRDAGADLSHENDEGKTALDLARESPYLDETKRLRMIEALSGRKK